MTVSKEQIKELITNVYCLALGCSQHLEEQHEQGENDKPRYFFDNIAKALRKLDEEI